ncbi:hypothetical protein [Actinoplanes sp. NPDC049802]|uniref:hypothetical protein n=1 Tax=Actinoplanes sp. NPDC049802 TaxID=3154742 RepID=UPI0033DD3BA4
MRTDGIRVLHPATGELIRVCPGPDRSGGCPLAAPNGVVPCAGLLIAPQPADPEYWPLPVPHGYRYCDVPWNVRARACLRKAEWLRERWRAGLRQETERVWVLAGRHDPRYRKMTPHELNATALWRWRLSAAGQALRRAEQKAQEQGETYLAFTEHRRNSGHWVG